MMSSNANKAAYLQTNLCYELRMLRHALTKITQPQFPLDWNAYFQSFAVNARNLYGFLTNDDKSENFKAKDFIEFKATKTDNSISMFQRLNPQVFHLGKNRPTDQEKQANLDHAKQVSNWIETNFAAFINGLGVEYGSKVEFWNNADPSKVKSSAVPQQPTRTNADFPATVYTFSGSVKRRLSELGRGRPN
jgi:hypothetical protein